MSEKRHKITIKKFSVKKFFKLFGNLNRARSAKVPLLIFALTALIGFTMITCNKDDGNNVYINEGPPEGQPDSVRWAWKWDENSTAKADYSVNENGVCKITVSGAPETENDAWRTHVAYMYSQNEGSYYVYNFDAWTEPEGDRILHFHYFENNDDEVWIVEKIPITSKLTNFTVLGHILPRIGENPAIRIRCADQLGTFYVKINSIKERTIEIGKLTITNFSGNPGLSPGPDARNETYGFADYWSNEAKLVFSFSGIKTNEDVGELWPVCYAKIKGNTITLNVWETNNNENTYAPFTGNKTIEAGDLLLKQVNFSSSGWEGDDFYLSKVPITFTNGNATINFETQMGYYGNSGGNGGNDPDEP